MIMGVPAHDQRDYDFAIKYQLPIVKVIDNSFDNCAYEGDGKHINSPLINGLNIKEATKKIINYLIENKIGSEQQQTKLHD
jgi:leucyl-tRNA synthetase